MISVVVSTAHEVEREQGVLTISVVVSTAHEVEREQWGTLIFRSYTIPGTVNPVHKGTK